MHKAGDLISKRVNQIIVENETLRAGFAALPYLVMEDLRLSIGARMTYAYLLKFAWQEGATFVSQAKLAESIGLKERQLRRYLKELEKEGYLVIERRDKRFTNTYVLKDVKTKLKKKGR
jgi:biotin operon repressor